VKEKNRGGGGEGRRVEVGIDLNGPGKGA